MKLLIAASSLAGLFVAGSAFAASDAPLLVGDVLNGGKLYTKHCAACHGDDATGGNTSIALNDSSRLTVLRDDQLFALIQSGKGAKKPKDHSFKKKMSVLDSWDIVAYTRTLHMTLSDFFPAAARYIAKGYEIDKYGLERIQDATGKKLKDKSAPVFTFFDFEDEQGRLRYVPQDPILLDELKKDKKAGYLVFLPFSTKGFEGEIGVAMDKAGVITKLLVHEDAKGADLLNKSLSRFEGMGKKGQTEKFKVGGSKNVRALANDIFPLYMRAMETVTMYDRDERERTWADE